MADNIKLKIREQYGMMSRGEKKISDYILSDGKECLGMTTMEIAQKSGVSSASVIRYVQKLGFDGLESFKLAFAAAGACDSEWSIKDLIVSPEDSTDELCEKVRHMVITAIDDFFYQIDKGSLKKAIEVLKKSRRIYTLGIGASMMSAYDLFHKLKRADFDSLFSLDTNMMMEFFNYMDSRDAVVAFSYSGQSMEIIQACEAAREQKVTVIVVTRNSPSRLQETADICLFVPNQEEVMRVGAFTSTNTSMMMADLLYLGMIQENLAAIEVELVKTRKLVERLKIKNREEKAYDRN